MKFLIKQLKKSIGSARGKTRVGFICELRPYSKVMASTRLRVYDVINAFDKDENFHLEVYNPLRKYDILIFQKKFDNKAYSIAKKNKKTSKIILDINVDYLNEKEKYIKPEQRKDMKKFLKICDGVISSSEHLRKIYQKEVKFKVVTIEENIPEKLLNSKKKVKFKKINFLWSGYSVKAVDLLLIKNELIDLYKKYPFKICIVAEKDPELKIGKIPIIFHKYEEKRMHELLLEGNVFLAPRDLSKPYNLGHTFTKIGVAMALGIPVIAAPVPSYTNSPAILCNDNKEWKEKLSQILKKDIDLEKISSEGRKYCKENYQIAKIKKEYEDYFKNIL